MPVSAGRLCNSCDMASRPPAEAPIATTGNLEIEFAFFAITLLSDHQYSGRVKRIGVLRRGYLIIKVRNKPEHYLKGTIFFRILFFHQCMSVVHGY